MADPLSALGQTAGAVLSLPASILKAYATGYGQLPQRYADEAQQRALALQSERANLDYLQSQRAFLQNVLPTLPKEQQLSLLTNPGELGKALSSNIAQHVVKPGEADISYGNHDTPYFAPQIVTDNGRINSVTPQGATPLGDTGPTFNADGLDTRGLAPQAPLKKPVPLESTVFSTGGPYRAGGAGPQLPQVQGPPGLGDVNALLSGGPAPGGMVSASDVLAAAPGATITSGYRTPGHNAAVRGVPGSWHTVGSPDAPGALDVTPPAGMPMGTLASAVTSKLPQVRVLNEGNHVHVQPNATNTGQGLPQIGAPQAGDGGMTGNAAIENRGPLWATPHYNPQTNRLEQTNSATGEVRDAGAGAFNPETLRKSVLDHEDYKQATASMAAYKAMVGNADKMTGPSAYSMLDTFARAINPGAVARPQVIQTIEANLGLPAQMIGSLDSKFGKGNLPPDTRQQILDAVVKFAQAHWDAANALNQSNRSVATRTGLDPANVVAPLDGRPAQMHLLPVTKDQLKAKELYQTNRGPAVWDGQAFTSFR